MTKRITSQEDIKRLGTIMGIWAHPDDDTFSMGGIMAAAAENGQKVVIVMATRGEAGIQDENRWPASQLGAIRTKEMEDALECLGVNAHCWLDYPDGGCNSVDQDEAVARIIEQINKYKPDTIMTFGPDGMTGHDDHKTVSNWAKNALKKSSCEAKIYHTINTKEQYEAMLEVDRQFNIFFNIDMPDVCKENECSICFAIPDKLYLKKLKALRAMPSQTEGMLRMFEGHLKASLGTEAFTDERTT